jgi:hypothetical protein
MKGKLFLLVVCMWEAIAAAFSFFRSDEHPGNARSQLKKDAVTGVNPGKLVWFFLAVV